MKLFKYIISIILIYVYIYSPAIQAIPFGLDKIILVWALLYLFLSKKGLGYFKLFSRDYKYLSLIVFFSFFVFLIHASDGGLLLSDLFLLIEPIPVSCAIILLVENKFKIELKDVIMLASGIAGLITVYLLFNQDLAMHLKTSILRVPEILTTYFSFRGFGFADGLLNSYPTAQGLILGLLIIGFFKTRKVFFLLAIPIFISIIVNARTGVVPILVGLVLMFFIGSNIKNKLGILAGVVITVILFVLVIDKITLSSDAEDSLSWGKTTIDIISGLLKGEEVESSEAFTKTMVVFPDNLGEWLLGTGYNIFSKNPTGKGSDIGYFIRLLYGGIFYLIITFIYVIYICRRIHKSSKVIGWLMFITFVLYNYKTDFLTVAPCSRLFFLVYAIIICSGFDSKQKSPAISNIG